MNVKLSDSQIGLVFSFENDTDEYMITKREKAPDTQYGLLKMEVIKLENSQPFYIVINTRTDEYRMYTDSMFGVADNADVEYSQNMAKGIVETPSHTDFVGLKVCQQGLVFFNRGLYGDARGCFFKAMSSTDEQELEDNMLYTQASYLAASHRMHPSHTGQANQVFKRLEFLDGTRHRDIARVMWLCLYWQYGKNQVNTVSLNRRFDELKDQLVREISNVYAPIVSSLKSNVSEQTRVLFLDFVLIQGDNNV